MYMYIKALSGLTGIILAEKFMGENRSFIQNWEENTDC